MAKVKDQVLPGSDVSYVDSTGAEHYDADLIRHIMPNAYPLPSLNPTGVAKRSQRYHQPAHQGRGSVKQYPKRRCFSECSEFWNTIADECPEYCTEQMDASATCNIKTTNTSKKQIYKGKLDQGVMCSFYDLFMGCCLSGCLCVSLIIDGQEGEPDCSVNSDMDCFKCPQNDPDLPNYDANGCKKCTPQIGYTSQQMQGGASQSLTYEEDTECPDAPPCPPECIKWEIISGGGSFNNDPLVSEDPVTITTGTNPTYYAPTVNWGCANNPTIAMTDCRGQKTILSMAVNVSVNTRVGRYWTNMICNESAGKYGCSGRRHYIYCDGGDYVEGHSFNANYASCAACWEDMYVVWGADSDDRTAEQLAAGCCPEQLL